MLCGVTRHRIGRVIYETYRSLAMHTSTPSSCTSAAPRRASRRTSRATGWYQRGWPKIVTRKRSSRRLEERKVCRTVHRSLAGSSRRRRRAIQLPSSGSQQPISHPTFDAVMHRNNHAAYDEISPQHSRMVRASAWDSYQRPSHRKDRQFRDELSYSSLTSTCIAFS